MINKLRNNIFFRNSLLYTIGGMMSPLIGFILLPVYTNYLSPADYGIMTTTQTLVGMLQIVLVLSLNGAITRFYYDYLDDREKQKKYLGSMFSFVLLFSSLFCIILILFNRSIGGLIFTNIPTNPFFFYMVGLSWLNALLLLPLALLRAQEKAGLFLCVNILQTLLTMGITVYFIVYKGLGAQSALLSQGIVLSIIVLVLYLYCYKYIKFTFNTTFIKESLAFSLPLLPHVASGWIIASSDRIILEKFIDLSELGIYALAVQVSMVLSIFYTSVNNALVPRYTLLRKKNNRSESRKLLRVFLYIVIIFGLLSIPIAMIATNILSNDSYNQAIWLIPFLIIGHMIKGIYFIPVAKLFYAKKTKAVAKSSTIAALINIGVNFALIPIIGIYGAIISTLIAELCRTTLIYSASRGISKHGV